MTSQALALKGISENSTNCSGLTESQISPHLENENEILQNRPEQKEVQESPLENSDDVISQIADLLFELVDRCKRAIRRPHSKAGLAREERPRKSLRKSPNCNICGARAEDAKKYGCDELHSKHPITVFNCLYCGMSFPTEQSISNHIQTTHMNAPISQQQIKPYLRTMIGPLCVTNNLANPQWKHHCLEQIRLSVVHSNECPICRADMRHQMRSHFASHLAVAHRSSSLPVFYITDPNNSPTFFAVTFDRILAHAILSQSELNASEPDQTNYPIQFNVERETVYMTEIVTDRRRTTMFAYNSEHAFQCVPCHIQFYLPEEIVRHFCVKHLKNPLNNLNWIKVLTSDDDSAKYSCPFCGFTADSVQSANKHIVFAHALEYADNLTFHCSICEEEIYGADVKAHFELSSCAQTNSSFSMSVDMAIRVKAVHEDQLLFELVNEIHGRDNNPIVNLNLFTFGRQPVRRIRRRRCQLMQTRSAAPVDMIEPARPTRITPAVNDNDVIPSGCAVPDFQWVPDDPNSYLPRPLSKAGIASVFTVSCSACKFRAYSTKELSFHARSHEPGQGNQASNGPLTCFRCQLQFGDSGKLFEHELRHTNFNPYRCSKCRATFFERNTALQHLSYCVSAELPEHDSPSSDPFCVNVELHRYDFRELNSVKFEIDRTILANQSLADSTEAIPKVDFALVIQMALSSIIEQRGGTCLQLDSWTHPSNAGCMFNDDSNKTNNDIEMPLSAELLLTTKHKSSLSESAHTTGIKRPRKKRHRRRFLLTVSKSRRVQQPRRSSKGRITKANRVQEGLPGWESPACQDLVTLKSAKEELSCEQQEPRKAEDGDENHAEDYDCPTAKNEVAIEQQSNERCEKCGLRYGWNRRLIAIHKAQHEMEFTLVKRRYQCKFCPFSTDNSVGLKGHEYRHLPEGPFFCRLCSLGFCTEAECCDHVRRKHDPLLDLEHQVKFMLSESDMLRLTPLKRRRHSKRNRQHPRPCDEKSGQSPTPEEVTIGEEIVRRDNYETLGSEENQGRGTSSTQDISMKVEQKNNTEQPDSFVTPGSEQEDVTIITGSPDGEQLTRGRKRRMWRRKSKASHKQSGAENAASDTEIAQGKNASEGTHTTEETSATQDENRAMKEETSGGINGARVICVKCRPTMHNTQLTAADDTKTSTVSTLTSHALHCHSTFRAYSCELCPTRTISLEAIELHCKLYHGVVDAYARQVDDLDTAMACLVACDRFIGPEQANTECVEETSTNELGMLIAECTPISFKCKQCCICFAEVSQLCEHLRLAGHEMSCKLCPFISKSLSEFMNHVWTVHRRQRGRGRSSKCTYERPTGTPSFKCIVCQRKLDSRIALINHLSQVHHVSPDESNLVHTDEQCRALELLNFSPLVLVHRNLQLLEVNVKSISSPALSALASEILLNTDTGRQVDAGAEQRERLNRLRREMGTCPTCLALLCADSCSCDEYGMTRNGTPSYQLNCCGHRSLLFNLHSIIESQSTSNSQISQSGGPRELKLTLTSIAPFLVRS